MNSFYMRLTLYIFLIIQIFNFLGVFAEKTKEDSSQLNSVKWEKVEEKTKPLKKIIWRSYNNDESYFEDDILENKNNQEILQIQPHIIKGNSSNNYGFIFLFLVEPYLTTIIRYGL